MHRLIEGAAALLLAGGAASAASAQDVAIALAPGETLLNVEATGVHRGRPDMMQIRAGVVTTGATGREALAANARLADKMIAAVRAAGIEPSDVQTSQLSVNPVIPNRDDDARAPKIQGYVARNTMTLRLRDLGKAAETIDALFAAGANEVSGPGFGHKDPAPAERAARRDAVAEARIEADTYAEAFGMRITRVLRVSERGRFELEDDGTIIVTGSRIPSTPIEPGEIATRVQLWVDYAMAPK